MTRSKGCLILFILSLIAGTIAGYLLVTLGEEEHPDPLLPVTQGPDLLDPTPTPTPNPDRAVLVLGVDNLEYPNPALEGAWIVSLEENADGILHFRIVTLYPVIEATVQSTHQIPFLQQHPVIQIDPHDLFAAGDLAPISYSADQWSQVIVLDEIAINTIIMMQNLNFHPPAPTPSPGVFIKPWENPQGTYEQHERILSLLCHNPTPMSDPNNIDVLTSMEGPHIRTTLPEGGLRALWQVINYMPSKQVICTLEP